MRRERNLLLSQGKAKDGHWQPSTKNETKRDDTRERQKTTQTMKVLERLPFKLSCL
jgi:hypothetical protein